MSESDIAELLNRMVHHDVKTSYKPYLLRAILELSKDSSRASFDELATFMFAFAWNDTINPEYHFRKSDAILWVKTDLMEETALSEYASFDESLEALQKISSEKIKNEMRTVVFYSPWSMLNIGQWTNELGLLPTYWKKWNL